MAEQNVWLLSCSELKLLIFLSYRRKDILLRVVYLHQITDRRLSDESFQSLRMFLQSPEIKARIGGVVLATSMWSNMISERSKDQAEYRERQVQERWSEMMESLELADLGVMRFEESSASVENIIRRVTR